MDGSSSESDMNDSSQTSSSESDVISSDVGEGGGTRKRIHYQQIHNNKIQKFQSCSMLQLYKIILLKFVQKSLGLCVE